MWDLKELGVKFTTDSLHADLLREAHRFGYETSPDPSTKIGSLIVDDRNNILVRGANRFPRRLQHRMDRAPELSNYYLTHTMEDGKPIKYEAINHAERDIIFQAAEDGIRTGGRTAYVTAYACLPCANALAASGLETVVGHRQFIESFPDRWKGSVKHGLRLLERSGVEILMYDGELGVKARKDMTDISV